MKTSHTYIYIIAKHPHSAGFPSPSGGAAHSATVKEEKKNLGARGTQMGRRNQPPSEALKKIGAPAAPQIVLKT